jgi:hypothetical protein
MAKPMEKGFYYQFWVIFRRTPMEISYLPSAMVGQRKLAIFHQLWLADGI